MNLGVCLAVACLEAKLFTFGLVLRFLWMKEHESLVTQHILIFFIALIVFFYKCIVHCLILFINSNGTNYICRFEVLDEEPGDDEESGGERYTLYNKNLTLFSYIFVELKWYDIRRFDYQYIGFLSLFFKLCEKSFGSFLSFYRHNALLGIILMVFLCSLASVSLNYCCLLSH